MEISDIINKIKKQDIGCGFYKADLHVHTPASKDFEGEASPEEIVQEAISKRLDIIAITDHNSVEWCEKVINASKDTKLNVFPGVEISTNGGRLGLHFLAIFDKKKPIQEIKDCLARTGLDTKKQGDESALSDKSMEGVLEEIKRYGGIAIGAHSNSPKGICGGMKGKQRTGLIRNPNLTAIEVNDLKNIKFFDGTDKEYERLLACTQSSDAHKVSDIGRSFTLIKMGELSIEGLRQAFYDPESRIRFDDSQIHNHPSILGMHIEGGFLDNCTFCFNENMNSLIGGKGTGKTTSVELIRFVLNSDHQNDKMKAEYGEMIKNVLGDGIVYLLVKTKDSQLYVLSRRMGEDTIIFREEGDILDMNVRNFQEFFDLECYSQGELISIARNSTNQLNMLDKYIDFEELKENEKILVNKLSNNANLIIQNKEKIDELITEVERLPAVEEKIRIIEEKGLKNQTESQKKWEYEKTFMDNSLEELRGKINNLEKDDSYFLDELIPEDENTINKKQISNFKEIYDSLKLFLEEDRERIIGKIKENIILLEKNKKEWDKLYNQQIEGLKKLKEELKLNDINLNDYIKLEREKSKLRGSKKEITKRNKDKSKFELDRTKLINELLAVRKKISQKRKNEINGINENLKNTLNIVLETEADNNFYTEWLIDCLKGSKLLKEQTKTLCDKIKPLELFGIVQNKEEDRIDILCNRSGLGEAYFNKMLMQNNFLNKIYELETINLEDKLEIKLYDNGWKNLSHLSTGGKCTAILLIAMLERTTPLLIDQPEDSLDNSFIYKSIVKIIRKLKDKRQLIIVTHNANIPVLGDCELMFVMSSNGLNGEIKERGVIDKRGIKETVQIILEGGEEAFKKRKEKYGI